MNHFSSSSKTELCHVKCRLSPSTYLISHFCWTLKLRSKILPPNYQYVHSRSKRMASPVGETLTMYCVHTVNKGISEQPRRQDEAVSLMSVVRTEDQSSCNGPRKNRKRLDKGATRNLAVKWQWYCIFTGVGTGWRLGSPWGTNVSFLRETGWPACVYSCTNGCKERNYRLLSERPGKHKRRLVNFACTGRVQATSDMGTSEHLADLAVSEHTNERAPV